MSKEAMKLALEMVQNKMYAHAEMYLTEALAKQEQGEPVAWNDRKDEWTDEIAAHHPTKTKAYKHFDTAMLMVGARHSKQSLVELVCWLLQKSQQPKQEHGEPVAWRHKGQPWQFKTRYEITLPDVVPDSWEPLYTTPQQRKPLTDEQLKNHYQNNEWLDGVRFAEQFHGIKE